MANSENSELLEISSGEPREDIIKTAVKFLQNPQVAKSPLAQSQKFLQKKGLTDQEIKIACERSGAYNNYYNLHYSEKPVLPPTIPPHHMLMHPHQTLFYKVRDTLQSIAIFSGLGYVIYLFYKRFIRPWLFGEKKKKSIEDSLSELNKTVTESISDLRENLTEVKVQVDRLSHSESSSTHSQLHDLKNEISTVKGLLLNRKQFPSVPSAPLVPPSIPAWQLSSVQPDQDGDNKGEDIIDIGSGSGSSETEVVTKNSDSSLEII